MPLTPLVLDEISLELLRHQGLDTTAVPAAGRAVIIHHNGDLTVDVTERMHPDVAASCVVAAQTVGLDVAGIDLIAGDIGQPLEEQNGAVIEVNASPGLVMHLKPLVGNPRPVGEAIVKHLFPLGESGRVPLVAVSGSSGKTLVASLVASMLTAASHNVGEASSRGLRIGQRVLSSKDCADAASARRVLVNPFVDAIVFEASERRVIQEGLAFDRCDVAVVTNLDAGAHLLEPDEKERVLLAKAIRAPVDVVLPEGCAVLNAEDPEVATMAVKCRGKIVYFARDAETALMREHLDKGGQVFSLEKGTVVARQMAQLVPILEVDQLPSSPPIASLLAAVAAGVALGLTPHAVREGIAAALLP